ncbi:MAG TPA: hypothetical protein PKW67_10665, partial [Syntrophomonadaceae bacterium]|nr:hypothetical protein [Syntrophomonadaceae bacterium]
RYQDQCFPGNIAGLIKNYDQTRGRFSRLVLSVSHMEQSFPKTKRENRPLVWLKRIKEEL